MEVAVIVILAVVTTVLVGIVRLVQESVDSGRLQQSRLAEELGRKAHLAELARQSVERRLFEVMCEFPQLTDEQVATLVHDELVNARIQTPDAYAWCVPATAGRVRRNAVFSALRDRR